LPQCSDLVAIGESGHGRRALDPTCLTQSVGWENFATQNDHQITWLERVISTNSKNAFLSTLTRRAEHHEETAQEAVEGYSARDA
jgi:hypothetical protein